MSAPGAGFAAKATVVNKTDDTTAETATHLIIYFDDIPGSESSDCLLRFLWKTFSLLKFTYSFCQISSSTGKKPFGTSTTWHIFYIIS